MTANNSAWREFTPEQLSHDPLLDDPVPEPTTDRAWYERERARAFARNTVRRRCREIADLVRLWNVCAEPACRRSRACRTRTVPCFEAEAVEARQRLEMLMEWQRFDGPLDDAALDALAADFRKLGAPI